MKSKKTNIEDRYFHYFVLRSGNYFFLKQRKSNDIWKNLFDFPLVETRGHLHATKLMQMNESKKITGNKKIKPVRLSPVTKHLLSHRRLHIRFVEIIVPEKFNVPVNWIRVHTKRLDQYAVPVPVRNYLASGNGRIAGERQL